MSYPPEHLLSQKRRVTSLPLIAFYGGLGASAPAVDMETRAEAWDVAEHHFSMHVIDHRFGGDVEAYTAFLKEHGCDGSIGQRAKLERALDNSPVPGI